MTFADFSYIYIGVFATILASVLFLYSSKKRIALLSQFSSKRLIPFLSSNVSGVKIAFKSILICLAILTIFLALARPQYGYKWQEVKTKGVDIVFALDASKSMLATDIKPKRLDRAKLAIKDFVLKLKSDRVGIVAFSGQAFLQCPLTLDYDAFRMSLDAIDTNIIQRGGTNIAAAITESENAFADSTNYKVIVLISDGEELESSALDKAKDASKRNVVIYTLGVGSATGKPITIGEFLGKEVYLKDESGNPVLSKLNETVLKEIATLTNGIYANLSQDGMETIYEDGIKKIPESEISAKMKQYAIERFQIPLFIALVFLALELLIGTRKFFSKSHKRRAARNIILSSLLLMAIIPDTSKAGEVKDTPQQENKIVDAQKPIEVLNLEGKNESQTLFNLALDKFNDGKFEESSNLNLDAVKKSNDVNLHAKAYYNAAISKYHSAMESAKGLTPEGFKNSVQRAHLPLLNCVGIGTSILKEADKIKKAEANLKENTPSKIESEEFQNQIKQTIQQSEEAQKNIDIEKQIDETNKFLEESEKHFSNAAEIDESLPEIKSNIANTNKALRNIQEIKAANKTQIDDIKTKSKDLEKIVEELKKLIKQEDNKDDKQNQDNQDSKDNKDDKQNQDKKDSKDDKQDKNNKQNKDSQNQDNQQQNKDSENQKDSSKDNQNKADSQQNQDGQNKDKKDSKDSEKNSESSQSKDDSKTKNEQAVDSKEKENQQEKQSPEKKDGDEKQNAPEASYPEKSGEKNKDKDASASEEGKQENKGDKKAPAPAEPSEDEKVGNENFRSQEGAMTRKEAMQLLDSLKGSEKRLPFKGYGEQQKRYDDKKYKDW